MKKRFQKLSRLKEVENKKIVDASGLSIDHLASLVAAQLQSDRSLKSRQSFDSGERIVIVNVDRMKLTESGALARKSRLASYRSRFFLATTQTLAKKKFLTYVEKSVKNQLFSEGLAAHQIRGLFLQSGPLKTRLEKGPRNLKLEKPDQKIVEKSMAFNEESRKQIKDVVDESICESVRSTNGALRNEFNRVESGLAVILAMVQKGGTGNASPTIDEIEKAQKKLQQWTDTLSAKNG